MKAWTLSRLLGMCAVCAALWAVVALACLWFGSTGAGFGALKYRWTSVAVASIVGAALASAGVAYQAVLRNPLAEPYLLGVSGEVS
ncbi:MAG: iron chelate uptake ABC transporter family permease subunit, partial [Dehalococcoidia bacterium]